MTNSRQWNRIEDYDIRVGHDIESHEPIEVILRAPTHSIKRGLPPQRKKFVKRIGVQMTLAPMSIISVRRSGLERQEYEQKTVLRNLGYTGTAVSIAFDQVHDTGMYPVGLQAGASNVYSIDDESPRRHIALTIEDPGAFWKSTSKHEKVSMRAMADLVLTLANPTETTIQQIQTNIDNTWST